MTVTSPSTNAADAAQKHTKTKTRTKSKHTTKRENRKEKDVGGNVQHDQQQDSPDVLDKLLQSSLLTYFEQSRRASTIKDSETSRKNEKKGKGKRRRQQELRENEKVKMTDLKENKSWGAFSKLPPDDATFRIAFQNVRGLPYDKMGLTYDALFQSMKERHVNIFGCVETNVNWTVEREAAKMKRSASKTLRHAHVNYVTSEMTFDTVYKPGGALLGVTGKWTGRILESGYDPRGLGRWAYVRLTGKGNTKLTVITAYRVCEQSVPGPKTVMTQEYCLLAEQLTDHILTPRQQFLDDLADFIDNKVGEGDEIVLAIDANESIEELGPWADFLERCDLFDLTQKQIEDEEIPPSREGSKKRIDYIVGTERVYEASVSAGCDAINSGVSSNHRLLHVDLHIETLLGRMTRDPDQPEARKLQSTRPARVWKYKQILWKLLEAHRVKERVREIFLQRHDPPADFQQRINAIDRDITRAMLSAEKRLGHYPLEHAWSPEVQSRYLLVRLWQLVVSQTRTGRDMSAQIRRYERQMDEIPEYRSITFKCAKEALESAKKEFTAAAERSAEERDQALSVQAAAMELAGKGDQATILKNLRRIERQRKTFKKLRRIFKDLDHGRLSSVLTLQEKKTEDEPDKWVRITDSDTVQQLIQKRNEEHFNQASETPIGDPETMQMFGWDGNSDTCNKILEGEPPAHLPDRLKNEIADTFFQQFKTAAPTLDTEISIQEFKEAFAKWKESTTTSPSQRHLGHYRSLMAPDGHIDEESLGEQIMLIHYQMVCSTLATGTPLERWRNCISCHIEKDKGSPKLHRLRIIHIYEADYNLLLKLLWSRKLIRHAEHHILLGNEQFGSRPCKSSLDVVLRKALTYVVTNQEKSELITFDNDASSCYDRILPVIAALASRRVGMTSVACQLMNQCLAGMKYFTRAGEGVSEHWYRHSPAFPIYGTGQGSCASPVVWILISVVLINALKALHRGMVFTSPDGGTVSSRPIDGIVDDTTIGTNVKGNNQTCLEEAQDLARAWEHLLFLSGGTLAREKCFFYHIQWKWENGRATMSDPSESEIILPRGDQEPDEQIQRKLSSEAHRTLGVRIAPDGNWLAELKHLKSKAKKYSQRLLSAKLSTTEAWLAYRTMYIPSMTYSAGITWLSKQQCDEIEKTARPAWLHAFGFNRNFPKAVAYAPRSWGGLGMLHHWCEQGIRGIYTLTGQYKSGSEVGKMVKIGLENFRLIIGRETCIFQQPCKRSRWAYDLDDWYGMIHDFSYQYGISIHIPMEPYFHPKCVRDSAIMSTLSDKWTRAEVRSFNRCRMYIRAIHVSDIASGDGKCILSKVFQGKIRLTTKLHWPRQDRPPEKDWMVWRKILREDFLSCQTSLHLRVALGP